MAKRTRPSGAANLPEEIVNEILLLLPARSVLRSRAVCRKWAASLASPGFAAAYAAKAKARRMAKLVLFAPSPASPKRSTAVYSCGGGGQGGAVVEPLFTVDRVCTDSLRLSSRPCNGLVLFSDTNYETYWVCNPSTGECRRLPQQHHRGLMYSSVGLVFDGRAKECKAVHLFVKGEDRLGCEVCSLGDGDPNRDRRWRLLTGAVERLGINMMKLLKALQAESTVTRVPPVFANGCLHWLLYPSRNSVSPQLGRDAILCFSGEEETFGFMSAPAGVQIEDYIRLDEHLPAVPIHLAEIDGSLCMVHDLRTRDDDHGESWLHVWALRDRSAGEWSLDYRVALTPLLARDVHCPRFITVLGRRGSSEASRLQQSEEMKQPLLMIATSQHKVHAYDPVTGGVETVLSVEETDIGFQKEAAAALGLALYEDSLNLIGTGNQGPRDKEVMSAMTEILLRLPLKSVAQSMSVCKRWCSLIQSDAFTTRMVTMKRRGSRISMVTNDTDQFFGFASLQSWLQAGPAIMDTFVSSKIVCSKPCHGLNLISTNSDDYLCNPCTGAVLCLGIRHKPHVVVSPGTSTRGNAFTVGRNVGFGFDQATGEHVAVEIGYVRGALACIAKTSRADAWSYVGKPPRPVTDMPPAHVGGTLYWMGEHEQTPQSASQERVVVALDISARAFHVLPCEPCRRRRSRSRHDAFLVELNGALSLVVANAEMEELEVWTMHSPGSWANDHKMCLQLQGHPDFSLKTEVVVPMEVDCKGGRILLNTGRALGYYDVSTGALSTLYSLNQLQLPRGCLAFPMLLEESLARIPDDELIIDDQATSSRVALEESWRRTDHPGNGGVTTPRFIFHRCQRTGCQGNAGIYSGCCRRQVCWECIRRCLDDHPHYGFHVPLLQGRYSDVVAGIQRNGLPLEHPSVPGPEFCYYYSTIDGDVARHVFVSVKDLVQNKQPRHLIECGYRMNGRDVRETWSCRYLEDDEGEPPLD